MTYIYKKVSVPKVNGYSIYKNAFLKELPIVLPERDIEIFDSMTQEQFNSYIRKYLNMSDDECRTVENTLNSYKELNGRYKI